MRKIVVYIVLLLILISCKDKNSYLYRGGAGLTFTTDSLYYSLGDLPFNIESHTISIPIELLGRITNYDRNFNVSLQSSDNEVYEKFSLNRKIKKNTLSDTVKVKIYRTKLDEKTIYKLTLHLEKSDIFPYQISENKSFVLAFSNILEMPIWWTKLQYYIGEYQPMKYRKFIEIANERFSKEQVLENPNKVLRIFKKVKIFFEQNPDSNVVFPDVYWEV